LDHKELDMSCATKIVAFFLAQACAFGAGAAPYVPTDGAQVVERIPSRNDPVQQELRRLRMSLAASPEDLRPATELARRYIETARSEADPRYLGYAQAALGRWWDQPAPPNEVRLLRATLLQATHQFPAALAELNAILQTDRNNAQAWLTRATIFQVQGEYDAAKESCAKLLALAPELVSIACMANVGSLNGQAARSYALLNATLTRNADAEPSIKAWARTLLAEMAVRQGMRVAAEQHFRQALAMQPSDSYLLATYADFLLDDNRPEEVLALLKKTTRSDGLLLRYAIALQRIDAGEAQAQIETLRARFDAAMLREDFLHQREQARFELQLLNRPQSALKLAQQNWRVQKEPADARVLLEAAIASGDKVAAQPVVVWLQRTGLEDESLATMISALSGVTR
jgi:Tfp pilus assembly protein PilF